MSKKKCDDTSYIDYYSSGEESQNNRKKIGIVSKVWDPPSPWLEPVEAEFFWECLNQPEINLCTFLVEVVHHHQKLWIQTLAGIKPPPPLGTLSQVFPFLLLPTCHSSKDMDGKVTDVYIKYIYLLICLCTCISYLFICIPFMTTFFFFFFFFFFFLYFTLLPNQ